jgi:cytochrome b6-f complex iron-sulfur subunit
MENMDGVQESRREFLANTIRGACLAASAPLLTSLLAACGGDGPLDPGGDTQIHIDTTHPAFQSLGNVGGIVAIDSGEVDGITGNGVFIIRDSENTVIVLDRTCTHQGCQVGEFATNGIATCPCHGSRYNTQGGVVNGPAPLPLRRYEATLEGSTIHFSV